MTTGAFEDEVELMPGVYLSRHRGIKSTSLKDSLPQVVGANATLSDDVTYLSQEVARLRLSVEALMRSNKELKDAIDTQKEQHLGPDPDFVEAIQENVHVIARQLSTIKIYQDRIQELQGVRPGQLVSGTCATEMTGAEMVDLQGVFQASSASMEAGRSSNSQAGEAEGNTDARQAERPTQDDGGVYL
ncbi:hypothetical protein BC832DRAFT_595412 [Gaertneriomyces semiglobifer]|nr:hypothetical protein BC832DRAFT_595412 [Gaertneriomyces semiglobifer]